MTLTAVAGKDANVAADEADRFCAAARANLRCLAGIALSQSGFANKERWRVIAQTQTGSRLNGIFTVRRDFPRRNFQMAAQRVRQFIASRQGAHGRAAHMHDGSAYRLTRKHLIEIDDAVHIGERHAQGAAYFGRNGFGDPAMEVLCGVQGRQKRGAPLRRQLGEDRAQGIEFAISHLVFQASASIHFYRCLFYEDSKVIDIDSMAIVPYPKRVCKLSLKANLA